MITYPPNLIGTAHPPAITPHFPRDVMPGWRFVQCVGDTQYNGDIDAFSRPAEAPPPPESGEELSELTTILPQINGALQVSSVIQRSLAIKNLSAGPSRPAATPPAIVPTRGSDFKSPSAFIRRMQIRWEQLRLMRSCILCSKQQELPRGTLFNVKY